MFPPLNPQAVALREVAGLIEQACCCLHQTIYCVVFSIRKVYALIASPERAIAEAVSRPSVETRLKSLGDRTVTRQDESETLLPGLGTQTKFPKDNTTQGEGRKRKKPSRRLRFDIDSGNQGRSTTQAGAGEGLENEKLHVERFWNSGDKQGLIDYIANVLHQDLFFQGKVERDHFESLQNHMLSKAKEPSEKVTIRGIFDQVEKDACRNLNISAKVNAIRADDLRQAIVEIDQKIDGMKGSELQKRNSQKIDDLRQERAECMLALEQQKSSVIKNWAPSCSWTKSELKPQTFLLRMVLEDEGLEAAKTFVRNQRSEKVLSEMLQANRHGDLEQTIRQQIKKIGSVTPRLGK